MIQTIYDLWMGNLTKGIKFIGEAPISIRNKLCYLMLIKEAKIKDIPEEFKDDELFRITFKNIIEG